MNEYLEILKTIFNGVLVITAIVAVRFYISAIRKNKVDVNNSEHNSNYQLLTYFNSHRDAMEKVFALENKPVENWSEDEYDAANKISLDFHILGSMIESGNKSTEMFCQMFYYAIPKTRLILDEYIRMIRKERHKSYWLGFDQLVIRTVNRHNQEKFKHLRTEFGEQAVGCCVRLNNASQNIELELMESQKNIDTDKIIN